MNKIFVLSPLRAWTNFHQFNAIPYVYPDYSFRHECLFFLNGKLKHIVTTGLKTYIISRTQCPLKVNMWSGTFGNGIIFPFPYFAWKVPRTSFYTMILWEKHLLNFTELIRPLEVNFLVITSGQMFLHILPMTFVILNTPYINVRFGNYLSY